ncbi:MAG: DUF2399 domain-containing protein [Lachnospiraceae bacterium]|nr:DUF2399 domain-containing protein [Lachnospiraceae bacterium]
MISWDNFQNKQHEENIKKALEYFKQPGFRRLLEGFRKRYVSLGHLGGTVTLHSLKEEEQDALEGFLGMNCHDKKSLTVSAQKMEKSLLETRFSDITLEELLFQYFPKDMVPKKELEELREKERKENFHRMASGFEDTKAGRWFLQMIEKKEGAYGLLCQDEEKNTQWTLEQIPNLLKAINQLPVWRGEKVWIPVFAAYITGNPHYFDEGSRMFRYLLYGICGICDLDYPKVQNAEIKAELLYKAGILKDDISSNVTCIGVQGYLESGELHRGMQGFLEQGEMMHLNLHHLGKLKSVHGLGDRVYVVENPSVFQKLAEETKGEVTVVCGNGQLRLAVLVLLDLLIESGCEIWYSGDFDPEGLCIAQKLKDRYKEKLNFWHYELEDYEQAKSKERLSESRLKQLDLLEDPTLQKIRGWIKKDRVAGYQENIWNRLKI